MIDHIKQGVREKAVQTTKKPVKSLIRNIVTMRKRVAICNGFGGEKKTFFIFGGCEVNKVWLKISLGVPAIKGAL